VRTPARRPACPSRPLKPPVLASDALKVSRASLPSARQHSASLAPSRREQRTAANSREQRARSVQAGTRLYACLLAHRSKRGEQRTAKTLDAKPVCRSIGLPTLGVSRGGRPPGSGPGGLTARGLLASDFLFFHPEVRSPRSGESSVRFSCARSILCGEARLKTLNRNDSATWLKLCEKLTGQRAAITGAQAEFSEELGLLRTDLDAAWDTLQESVGAYQDTAEEAARWVGEVVAAAEDWRAERGERWRKSEAGVNHVAWCESMQKVQSGLLACATHNDKPPVIEADKAGMPDALHEVGDLPSGVSEVKL
jgi:hypothetical protein